MDELIRLRVGHERIMTLHSFPQVVGRQREIRKNLPENGQGLDHLHRAIVEGEIPSVQDSAAVAIQYLLVSIGQYGLSTGEDRTLWTN